LVQNSNSNRAVLDEALGRGVRGFPLFDGGKCLVPASVDIESLQTALSEGGAGNPASQPGTGNSGRLQADAARSGLTITDR